MGNEFRTVILVPFSGMQLDVKLHISMYLLVCTILLLSNISPAAKANATDRRHMGVSGSMTPQFPPTTTTSQQHYNHQLHHPLSIPPYLSRRNLSPRGSCLAHQENASSSSPSGWPQPGQQTQGQLECW